MSEATVGKQTSFRRWDGDNYVHLSEIVNITGPGKTRETIDVTSLDTEKYREFITGMRDGGTYTFTMIFRRDTYDVIDNDFEDDDAQSYEVFLPDSEETSFEFEGLVTELPLTIVPDDKITVDVSIKVTGEPVLNSGSGSSA